MGSRDVHKQVNNFLYSLIIRHHMKPFTLSFVVYMQLEFTLYARNFNPKFFTDIRMPAKLFVAQVLARDLTY